MTQQAKSEIKTFLDLNDYINPNILWDTLMSA